MSIPQLDILLYAHDGRGVGHISRTVAIGMGLRRLYPELRVLALTGYGHTQQLINNAPLDWLKLPSYRTRVSNGKSSGIDGYSSFTDKEIGQLRAEQIHQIVMQYRPKVVLADHTPQGKHRELLPALAATSRTATRWLLGVRGVVGAVPQAGSSLSQQMFADHYAGALWYGDSQVLGAEQLQEPSARYGAQAIECGYVSRLLELHHLRDETKEATRNKDKDKKLAGVIAVPWLGEHSLHVLTCIAKALKNIGSSKGLWRIFADLDPAQPEHEQIISSLRQLDYCQLHPPGSLYLDSLLDSKTALIYGGYNSLTDVLAAGLPTVVLLRAMRDNEQQLHLELLQKYTNDQLLPLDEQQVTVKSIETALRKQLDTTVVPVSINMQGAAKAARLLAMHCLRETGTGLINVHL